MKPVFSIITVTYNAAQWIEKTIQNVLGQTYDNIEFIVIDGKSTDGTVDIIRKYVSHIAYWISEPDKGLYDAMNKGLERASGDYVWFINAGDKIYDEHTIQTIVDSLEQKDILPDIIYGETAIYDKNDQFIGMRRLRSPKRLTWKSFKKGMLVSHQSFIAKRAIAPLYDVQYRFSSDFDWCVKCMKKARLIYNSGSILSRYLDGGISTANRGPSLKERYRIMCIHYGVFQTIIWHIWFAIRFYTAKITRRKVI